MSRKAFFSGDPITIIHRLAGDHTADYADRKEAQRMTRLYRDVPSAFWLEPWVEEDVEAYYDVVTKTTVVFRFD